MFDAIAKFFQDGGEVMYVNLLVALFGLAVVLERLWVLGFKLRMDVKKFLASIETLVNAGNFDRAIKVCVQEEGKPAAFVVKAALGAGKLGAQAVAAAIDEAILEAKPTVQKRTGLLWGIANLATLIGLVGTVFGLIQAFGAIGLASPDQKSVLLTQGISHAMNNTAFGLSIAVSCVFFHMMVTSLAKGLLAGVELSAVRIENILQRRRIEVDQREARAGAAS